MAKEYIEREALYDALDARLNDLRKARGPFDAYSDGFDECIDRVTEFPAADVVEVVRCKDCAYFLSYDRACDHPDGLTPGGGDQFCSHGERRGE